MESGKTAKPNVLSGKRDMSSELWKFLGVLFGNGLSQQDFQDALSLTGSRHPGGDRVVIKKIEEFTGKKWTPKRIKAALVLAERIRSLCNHPSFIGREETPSGDPVSDHCDGVAEVNVATPPLGDTSDLTEKTPQSIATSPVVDPPRPATAETLPQDEPVALTGRKNEIIISPSNKTDKLKDLHELRERSIRDLAEFMGEEEEIIRDLLSPGNKKFSIDQISLVERVKDNLGLNNQSIGQTTKWIKNMASSGAPTDVCRRLGQLLGIRFHRDKWGKYSMEQVDPKSIGEINSNVASGKNDARQAETDLLNGLTVAITIQSPIEAISAS